jgi:histidyl-tRNA synthetase
MPYIAVKGMQDVYEEEAESYDYIESVFKAVCALYGFHDFRTPVLEYTEVFDRSTGESSDVVRKEMYTFLDKGDRSVTLRPEFTAGVARAIVEHKLYATEDLPIKACYVGPVFRYDRPQLGRYRQFTQAGVECVGVDSARYDAETICLAMQILSMLGFENLTLKINSIGDGDSRAKYREALKAYFTPKIDGMCADCHDRLKLNPMRILDCKVEADQAIAQGAPKMKDYLSETSEKRFYQTLSIIHDLGVDYEIDDSLVRGLDYYSEVVFEVHGKNKDGVDYGALLGGGHYDGMLKTFGGPEMAGVGFAFGLERVYSLMKDAGLFNDLEYGLDVYVMPIGEEVLDDVFQITSEVRSLGYSAETPFAALKLGSQFKKAEKRKAKFAIIVGEDELNKGVAQLKNLATQEQKEFKLDQLEEVLDEAFGEKDDCGHDHGAEPEEKK